MGPISLIWMPRVAASYQKQRWSEEAKRAVDISVQEGYRLWVREMNRLQRSPAYRTALQGLQSNLRNMEANLF